MWNNNVAPARKNQGDCATPVRSILEVSCAFYDVVALVRGSERAVLLGISICESSEVRAPGQHEGLAGQQCSFLDRGSPGGGQSEPPSNAAPASQYRAQAE